MELEALLLGLEPITAAAIGVGAIVLGSVAGAVDNVTGHNLTDTTRNVAKTGLVWALEAFDKVQSSAAEASESFQDLVAEAKAERLASKNGAGSKNGISEVAPREVTIG